MQQNLGVSQTDEGVCSFVSIELDGYLTKKGVKTDDLITVKFDKNITGQSDGNYHSALRLDDGSIVDLTLGQFTKKPESFIGGESDWIRRLEKITDSNVQSDQ